MAQRTLSSSLPEPANRSLFVVEELCAFLEAWCQVHNLVFSRHFALIMWPIIASLIIHMITALILVLGYTATCAMMLLLNLDVVS